MTTAGKARVVENFQTATIPVGEGRHYDTFNKHRISTLQRQETVLIYTMPLLLPEYSIELGKLEYGIDKLL